MVSKKTGSHQLSSSRSAKNGSDIDIVLVGDRVNLSVISRVSWILDDLYLPYTFDIAAYKQIHNEELLEHINRVGKRLYPDN